MRDARRGPLPPFGHPPPRHAGEGNPISPSLSGEGQGRQARGDALCGCGSTIDSSSGFCSGCGAARPVERGVLRLLANDHTFYEGAYRTQVHFGEQQLGTLTGRFAFPIIQFGYVRSVVEATPERGRLLELGCGSGVQLFGDLFDVVATDLSHQSLAETPVRYQARVQADVLDVEFTPGSFDTICASCFFEHFTGEQKDRLLERCLRWLRPGGALVLLFDTESANPVIRKLRREPDLYRKAFIETDGHVGLEPPRVNLERFERAGFVLESGIGLNRSLQRLPLYIWLDAYRERFGWAGHLAALGRRMSENRVLNRVYSATLHVWDHSIGRLFPESWSTLYLGVWRNASRRL